MSIPRVWGFHIDGLRNVSRLLMEKYDNIVPEIY